VRFYVKAVWAAKTESELGNPPFPLLAEAVTIRVGIDLGDNRFDGNAGRSSPPHRLSW
jgi:hypothetical protein